VGGFEHIFDLHHFSNGLKPPGLIWDLNPLKLVLAGFQDYLFGIFKSSGVI